MAGYEIWLTTDTGKRLALLDDVLWMQATRVANAIGRLSLGVKPSFDLGQLVRDRLIQVWRRPTGGQLSLWRVYFLRGWRFETQGSVEELRLKGPDVNDLLRRRIVAFAAGTSQAEKTATEAAAEKEDAFIDTTNWKQIELYGLVIKYPPDSKVREPNLTADFGITWEGNQKENQVLVEGWIIGGEFSDIRDDSIPIMDEVLTAKGYEEENCKNVSGIKTKEIGDSQAYYFYATDCVGFDKSRYFITGKSYRYHIRASYIGQNEQVYKNLTEKIIGSLTFN